MSRRGCSRWPWASRPSGRSTRAGQSRWTRSSRTEPGRTEPGRALDDGGRLARRRRDAAACGDVARPGRSSPAPHRGRHAASARAVERDVDRAGHRAGREAAGGRRGQRHLGRDPHGEPAGVLLGARSQGLRHHPQHRRPERRPHRAAFHALLLAADPHAATNAPAGDRRGERTRLRRRDVPLARRRDALRGASRATFNATGIVNGLTSTELAASWLLPAPRRRGPFERHAPHRPPHRRRRGVPDGVGVAGVPRRRPPGRGAGDRGADVRVQPVRVGDDQGHPLGQPREPESGGCDRDRGPQPAHARLHREPPGGDPGLRPGPRSRLHRRTPTRPLRRRTRPDGIRIGSHSGGGHRDSSIPVPAPVRLVHGRLRGRARRRGRSQRSGTGAPTWCCGAKRPATSTSRTPSARTSARTSV